MKSVIVTKKENGKFDVQILKSVQRPGVGEYTYMADLEEEAAKKLVEDLKADKVKRLQAVTVLINTEVSEIEQIIATQFTI